MPNLQTNWADQLTMLSGRRDSWRKKKSPCWMAAGPRPLWLCCAYGLGCGRYSARECTDARRVAKTAMVGKSVDGWVDLKFKTFDQSFSIVFTYFLHKYNKKISSANGAIEILWKYKCTWKFGSAVGGGLNGHFGISYHPPLFGYASLKEVDHCIRGRCFGSSFRWRHQAGDLGENVRLGAFPNQ